MQVDKGSINTLCTDRESMYCFDPRISYERVVQSPRTLREQYPKMGKPEGRTLQPYVSPGMMSAVDVI